MPTLSDIMTLRGEGGWGHDANFCHHFLVATVHLSICVCVSYYSNYTIFVYYSCVTLRVGGEGGLANSVCESLLT